MPSHQPYVAGPSDQIFRDSWDAVRIGQTARPQPGQDILEPVRFEADQVEVEAIEFEITQRTAEQIGSQVPCAASSLSAKR